jgi:hypothetical protein
LPQRGKLTAGRWRHYTSQTSSVQDFWRIRKRGVVLLRWIGASGEVSVETQSNFRLWRMWMVLSAAFVVSCAAGPNTPASTGAPPNINRLTPATGTIGATVTIVGSGFAAENNVVKFGSGYIKKLASGDGTTLKFTVPDGLDLCAPEGAGPCAGAYPRVRPGDYEIAVLTSGETSNTLTFTVTAQ